MRLSSGLKLFQNVTFSRYLSGLFALTFVVSLVFAASLSENKTMQKTRTYLREVISPVLDLYQNLTHTADKVFDQGKDILMTQSQLNALREEIEDLRKWKNVALSLMTENKALRKQVNALSEDHDYPYLTARVLTYPSETGSHRIIIQAGAKDGIKEGMPVITAEGLIGRVVDTGRHSSEVLLITDARSKIPVILEPIHQQAILSGDQDNSLVLDHLENEVEVATGMHVLTSGKGGNFPPGLFIGLTTIEDSKLVVYPNMNWTNLEYVQVLLQPDLDHDPELEG